MKDIIEVVTRADSVFVRVSLLHLIQPKAQPTATFACSVCDRSVPRLAGLGPQPGQEERYGGHGSGREVPGCASGSLADVLYYQLLFSPRCSTQLEPYKM